jgi:hypothetical protein
MIANDSRRSAMAIDFRKVRAAVGEPATRMPTSAVSR